MKLKEQRKVQHFLQATLKWEDGGHARCDWPSMSPKSNANSAEKRTIASPPHKDVSPSRSRALPFLHVYLKNIGEVTF